MGWGGEEEAEGFVRAWARMRKKFTNFLVVKVFYFPPIVCLLHGSSTCSALVLSEAALVAKKRRNERGGRRLEVKVSAEDGKEGEAE